MSSASPHFKLFEGGIDTLLDISIRYHQHRHFISAQQHNLLIDTKVEFVEALYHMTPVQKWPTSLIDLVKHKVLEELDQVSVA